MELVEKVREELHKLKDGDGWVLIHGLGGFGKTTLAAESVRSASLGEAIFPDGVFWLSVNEMSIGGKVDNSKLLEKLQNFIRRVDPSKDPPPNIEAAKDHLRKVMKEQYPHSLLILDDVWESEVAKAFGIRCRVLATSRNKDVISDVETPSRCFVPITEGLSDGEARQLLSKMTNKSLDDLPEEAGDIIQYCMGSPLALGIIAAKLSQPGAMWKRIVKQLKSRSQANNLHARVNAAIGLSIEDLPKESKERVRSLVVFANSAVIPAHVLDTFWNVGEFGGADIMDGKMFIPVCLSTLVYYLKGRKK